MIPVYMISKHNPPDTYGDCFRACVASLLEVDDVPHFYFDGCDGVVGRERLNKYLMQHHNMKSYLVGFSGDATLEEFLSGIEHDNPGLNFILTCGIAGHGSHAVVCCGGKVVHDPFYWPTNGDYEPIDGIWTVILFVPAVLYAA